MFWITGIVGKTRDGEEVEMHKKLFNSSTNASASYERRTDPDPESRETSNDRE